jgi:enoyl-CoA hydratase
VEHHCGSRSVLEEAYRGAPIGDMAISGNSQANVIDECIAIFAMTGADLMPYEFILTETRGRVGLITLNRPKELNALNHQLLLEVMEALAAFDGDENIGATVVTGNKRAFSVGADVKELAGQSARQMKENDFVAAFSLILNFRKPVIAAVSGYALGGGCELAMSCDLIVASETAKFGQPEVTIGVIPGAGGTQRLTHAVGKALAMEMILNNRTLSAREAAQFGLVNRVVAVEQYLDEALKLAEEITGHAPLAVRAAKKMINRAYDLMLTEGLHEERQEFYNLFATQDQKEGMNAFVEKRKPGWKGR